MNSAGLHVRMLLLWPDFHIAAAVTGKKNDAPLTQPINIKNKKNNRTWLTNKIQAEMLEDIMLTLEKKKCFFILKTNWQERNNKHPLDDTNH